MAFKKDTKVKTNFTKITISLASPDEIKENSYGEVTTVSFASASLVLQRIMNVPAESTSASGIRVLCAIVAV